jgi:hypothetical protein
MVEQAFDLLLKSLVAKDKKPQAHAIAGASTHWLRHAGAGFNDHGDEKFDPLLAT